MGMFDNLMAGSIGQPGPVQDWPGMFARHMSSVAPYWAAQHPRDIAMGFVGSTGPAKGIKAALDMSRGARMGRAAEQGFHETPLYHGTTDDFGAFDLGKAGTGTNFGNKENAVFLTSKSDVADSYLPSLWVNEGGEAVKKYGEGSQIMPLRVRGLEDFEVWDMFGGAYKPSFMKEALKEARKNKAPGVVFRGMRDPGLSSLGRPKESAIVAVFDPKRIRSTHAAFDPAKRNSPDLLAAGLGIPAGMFQQDQQGMFR